MVKKIILLLFCCALTSCNRDRFPFNKAALTYKGKLVYNNEFRIDGFYYHYMYQGGVCVTYFFQDGIYFDFCVNSSKLSSLPAGDFIDIPDNIRDVPYYWGAYIIDGNIIKIQKYDPQRYRVFEIQEIWATIENDTTIHFFRDQRRYGKAIEMDKTGHFRSTLSKPDSTNILIR